MGISSKILIGIVLTGASIACAHLSRGSLSVKEGESFTAGETVELTWKMAHAHPITHFVYFKPDNLSDWSLIDSVKGQSGKLDYRFSWTVPEITSNSAQIRIFLPEFSKTPSEKEDDFTLISLPFAIAPSKVAIFSPAGAPAVLHRSSPGTGKVFSLSGRVVKMHGTKRTGTPAAVSGGIFLVRMKTGGAIILNPKSAIP